MFHKSSNTISTYINGVMVASRQVAVLDTYINTSQSVIGANHKDRTNINFMGAIDEIRIYNRALSTKEVKALYDLEKPKDK